MNAWIQEKPMRGHAIGVAGSVFGLRHVPKVAWDVVRLRGRETVPILGILGRSLDAVHG